MYFFIFILGIKIFLKGKAGGVIPLDSILPPLDKYYDLQKLTYVRVCAGEPPLKCCKSSGGCHSAFNSDAPINCEGNPHYGPTSTAGNYANVIITL